MSYAERFYHDNSLAEARPWILFHRPEKLTELRDVERSDKNAAQDIAVLEALIADLREYRQALAARYAELSTMAYSERLELERRPDGWRGGGISLTTSGRSAGMPTGPRRSPRTRVFRGSSAATL